MYISPYTEHIIKATKAKPGRQQAHNENVKINTTLKTQAKAKQKQQKNTDSSRQCTSGRF